MRVLKFTEIIEDKDMRKITSVVRNEEAAKDEKSPSEKGVDHCNFSFNFFYIINS